MKRLRKIGKSLCLAAIAGLGFAACEPATAAGPTTAPADQPAQLGIMGVASLDQLQAEAKRLGIDLPPSLSTSAIEQMFRLGPGGMDTGKPMGIVMYWKPGWNISAGQGLVTVLPVSPKSATLDVLKGRGAQPVECHADIVDMQHVLFRRADHDLMWLLGQEPDLLDAADPAQLDVQFDPASALASGDHVLLRCCYDGRELHRLYPDAAMHWIQSVSNKNVRPAGVSDEAWRDQQAGAQFAEVEIAKLERVDITVGRSGDNLALRLGLARVILPAKGDFAAPGMPANTIARIDLAARAADIFPDARDGFFAIVWPTITDKNNRPLTEQQQQQVQDGFKHAADVFLGGKAISLGVEPQGQKAVVYLVDQQVAGDWSKQERDLVDQYAQIEGQLGNGSHPVHIDVQHYDSDLGPVQRLVVHSQTPAFTAYIDGVQANGDVYFAIADDDGKHVLDLARLPKGKPMDHLLTGNINLEQSWALAPKPILQLFLGSSYDAATQLVKGQTLQFTMDKQNETGVFSLTLSEQWIKQAIHIFLPNLAQDQNPPPQQPEPPHGPQGSGL